VQPKVRNEGATASAAFAVSGAGAPLVNAPIIVRHVVDEVDVREDVARLSGCVVGKHLPPKARPL